MYSELLTAISLAVKLSQNQINQHLLNELLVVEKRQADKLASIHQSIETLQIGPFYSGMTFLQDAKKEHRTDKERYELIQQAKQHFISSLGMYEAKSTKDYKDLFILGYIQSYVGLSWALLGGTIDSEDWLTLSKKSLDDSLDQQKEIIDKLDQQIKSIHSEVEWSLLGGASIPIIGRPLLAKSIQDKAKKGKHTKNELDTMVAFKKNTEDYENFVNQSLEMLSNHSHNQSHATKYQNYIPIAQELISNLVNSESLKNDKLKSGIKQVNNLLKHIPKE
nr:hypothetical protein [Fredinandcohnia onubensis]